VCVEFNGYERDQKLVDGKETTRKSCLEMTDLISVLNVVEVSKEGDR